MACYFQLNEKSLGTWTQDEICFVLLNLAHTACTVSTCNRAQDCSLMMSCSKTTTIWLRGVMFEWSVCGHAKRILSLVTNLKESPLRTEHCAFLGDDRAHLFVRYSRNSGNSDHFFDVTGWLGWMHSLTLSSLCLIYESCCNCFVQMKNK